MREPAAWARPSGSDALEVGMAMVTHMLHVWNIYLHLPQKSPKRR